MGPLLTKTTDSTKIRFREEIENLKSLKISLDTNPDKEMCKRLANNLGEIINRLETLEKEYARDIKDENPNTVEKQRHRAYQPSNAEGHMRTVQILNPSTSEIARAFVNALMQKLTQDMSYIKCIEVDNTKENMMNDSMPLIVVCLHSTRLQPDVDLAIKSVRRSLPYVVIILHIGYEKHLPALPSGGKLGRYEGVTFVDMGFNDQREIYKCRQNVEANQQLLLYLDQFESKMFPKVATQKTTEVNTNPTPMKQLKNDAGLPSEVHMSRSLPPVPVNPSTAVSNSRLPTPPPLLSDKPWRTFSMSGDKLECSVRKDIKDLAPEKKPTILLLGPIGAGKSSFINSCLSVSVGRKKTLANTGTPASSYKLESYTDNGLLKDFRLLDCSGIELISGGEFHPTDILFLLQGHVKNTYKFDPEKPMTTKSKSYRKKPKFEHKAHCVVFVIDSRTMHNGIPDHAVENIKLLQDIIKQEDMPRVLILTHADKLCDEVHQDASNIFRSLKLEKTLHTASEVFSIEMGSIHPVINYENDLELSTAKNIPILLALRQMMQLASDRVEHVVLGEEDDSD